MKKFLSQVVAGIAGLWLAAKFIPGVAIRAYPESSFFGFPLSADWQMFLVLGILLGLLNFFLKPVINAITLPLRIITLGLFSIAVSMAMIWLLDMMFAEIYVPWMFPLLYTTLVVWGINIALQKIFVKDYDD